MNKETHTQHDCKHTIGKGVDEELQEEFGVSYTNAVVNPSMHI